MALTDAQIEAQLTEAKRLKTAAGEREAHSLREQIEAIDYLANRDTEGYSAVPLRIAKIKNGGATLCSE